MILSFEARIRQNLQFFQQSDDFRIAAYLDAEAVDRDRLIGCKVDGKCFPLF